MKTYNDITEYNKSKHMSIILMLVIGYVFSHIIWIEGAEQLNVNLKYKDLFVLIYRINNLYDLMINDYINSEKINSSIFFIRYLFINTETHCFREINYDPEKDIFNSVKITEGFFTEKSEKVFERIDDNEMPSLYELKEELKENKNRFDIDKKHSEFLMEAERKFDELCQFLIEKIEILKENEMETKALLQLGIDEYSPINFGKREETRKIEEILNKNNAINRKKNK